ncbi:MAG: UDP-3-O-(3-hydroxymyristoyl)glucosamine N-acyltransferase [Legionellales bacterium]|nr:UDP-3-O-(3-hydroxymyristoyl)glucosamine N-acyltransferase [Legionellales bacterium]OUX66932.1 MAG: hypothetical protein CBD38_04180 [bacterium TMED178]
MLATELATQLSLPLSEECSVDIQSAASLSDAELHQLAYAGRGLEDEIKKTTAGVIIASADHVSCAPCPVLISKNPRLDFARALNLIYPKENTFPEVHQTACISEDVQIGHDVSIGPFTVIESGVRVGDGVNIGAHCRIGRKTTIKKNTFISSHVNIYHGVSIGENCYIESGVVIGSEGFGFVQNEASAWIPIKQIRSVILRDHVYLGSNTTVDRGALVDTILGEGVKIDNLSQIGHGVQIGDHTIISGCVAIGGSTHIGQQCMIGGAVKMRDNIQIADRVVIAGGSAVGKSILHAGYYCSSIHAISMKDWMKSVFYFKRLPKYLKARET